MPKLCEYKNCQNRACYGKFYGKPLRCGVHKEGMTHQSLICMCGKARPYFNEPGESNAICCSQCKTDTMVNIKDKRCQCGKAQPYFNEPGESNAICCKECKTETMVNIKDKRCQCGKAQPYFNEPGESNAICCKGCKTDTMVDVKNKRCQCGKALPCFNEPCESTPICCSRCKTDTMVNIKDKRCQCGKALPYFNEPGETHPICCSICKIDTMVDVKNKKCLGMGCTIKGNSKYKNYCTECFRREFPLDPLTFQIRSKTKEIAVRDFINSNFEGFQHDQPLYTSHCDCTVRRRIDHRRLIGNTLLAIETDENQHKGYDAMDEQTRYDDLYMAFSGKWVYIRFNPDKYVNDRGISKNPAIATRLTVLKQEIEKQIQRIQNEENTKLVEQVYLFYDGYAL